MLFINAGFVLQNLGIVEPRLHEIQKMVAPSMSKLEKLAQEADFMEMAASLADMFQKTVEPVDSIPPPKGKGKKAN